MRDNGEVCGVQEAKKLMEDIPNKVRDMMGILVEVNLKEKDEKQYLEIVTEAYPYPISFRGKYYQRSGATNQELKGAALDRFMLRKQGKTWDGVPVPYLKAEDLDNATFDLFRKYAKRSGRMEEADFSVQVRLRHGDVALSVSSRLVRMTVSPRLGSAMMLQVSGQPLSLSTRKGLRSKATRKLPKRLPKRSDKTRQNNSKLLKRTSGSDPKRDKRKPF